MLTPNLFLPIFEPMSDEVFIYTDGASSGNPGPGGYGVVLISGNHRKTLSEGFRCTTNNRMELLAVIKGLEALKRPGMKVTVVTDSQYVQKAITEGWLRNWVKINFKNKKNPDLWKRYLQAAQPHQVKVKWIRGHNGHAENEECDRLAVAAAKQPNLPEDEGFEG
jgi:ribonuclease HI